MTQENYILRSAKATPAHVSAYATSVLAVVDSLHISRKKNYQQPSVNKESMWMNKDGIHQENSKNRKKGM